MSKIKSWINKEFGIFKKAIHKRMFYSFLFDFSFYIILFLMLGMFGNIVMNNYNSVESEVIDIEPNSIENAQIFKDSMQGLIFRSLGYFLLSFILSILLVVVFKTFVYRTVIRKKNFFIGLNLSFFFKYLLFVCVLFLIMILPFLFVMFMLVTISQISSDFIGIGLIISQLIFIIFGFYFMFSTLHFFKSKKLDSLKFGFKIFNLKKYGFGFIMFFVFIFLINLVWSLVSTFLKTSDEVFMQGLFFIIVFVLAWFRFYVYDKMDK